MNLKVVWTSRFKKDYKLAMKRGLNIDLIDNVIRMLSSNQALPKEYNDHPLSGNWKDFRECHIEPDWLLIYRIEKDILVLTLQRTGSHSDLFNL
jgi:mRNA interferase YafQ